uniref:Uncharacterized protein n=1 Tax=viral metagenome TaxID=1070528 RepID=A0A6M3M472_9ZZZZ
MKEREAREMLKELFERHSVPTIPVKFHPKSMVTKGEDIPKLKEIGLGHLAAAVTVITRGEFNVNPVTRERWIEFYGLPSPTDVRHEFRHYLDLLGVEYIKKKG